MVMIKLNIHEAKTHLSRYLARLKPGESLFICKRNVPVAELRALPPPQTGRRPIGLARNTFQVPASFFEELPDEVLEAFERQA
jgi:antitoxin (DNA-binding transcriptional repressor) of toxin-antitoxin stability system